jgi:uncharacterized membrane protein HdeD (DUF308 family)
MITILLSAIDIVIGYCLMSSSLQSLFGYFTYIMLAKGILSVIGSLTANYLFDWMGYLDMITGIVLLMTTMKVSLAIFPTIGFLLLAKGVYSLLRSLFRF